MRGAARVFGIIHLALQHSLYKSARHYGVQQPLLSALPSDVLPNGPERSSTDALRREEVLDVDQDFAEAPA